MDIKWPVLLACFLLYVDLVVIVLGEHEHHIKRKAGFLFLTSCDLAVIGLPQ